MNLMKWQTEKTVAGSRPSWAGQAIDDYRREQQARRERQLECAADDIAALTDKLAELGITPITHPDETGPVLVDDDGSAVALIHAPADGTGRPVLACARRGRLWLRTADAYGTIVDAGDLDTLADVGRAIIDGPPPLPMPTGNAEEAERITRLGGETSTLNTDAICYAITGLTHAVLAVADELREVRAATDRRPGFE
jgi:hypothetical protein